MDWNQLGEAVLRLLRATRRFGANTFDTQSLFIIANEDRPDWDSDPARKRLMFQALDLLEREELVVSGPSGVLSLTGAGRAARDDDQQTWMPDPTTPAIAEWIELEELQEALDARRSESMVTIARLSVSDWRQFASVDIVMHPRLTVLTGANAAGKTTLLNLLAPHFSWAAQLVSVGATTASTQTPTESPVGNLHYSNGVRAQLWESPGVGVSTSNVNYSHMESVAGIFISSHRSVSSYRQIEHLPARFSTADTMLQQFASEVQARYSGGASQYPPLYRMKEALISAALHGYGNQVVRETPAAVAIWEGFQLVLKDFLPQDLKFQGLLVENGEMLMKTESGEFPLEAASGGLSAMLELAWQIFLRGQNSSSFTVCIDEPENHLHPELQRVVIPALLNAFPQATFIVATHSPFVVTATRDCSVYALGRFGDDGRISSHLIEDLNSSATADETLQSVLGLETPLPLWAQQALAAELDRLPENVTEDDLRALRSVLVELGLGRQFPAAIASIAEVSE